MGIKLMINPYCENCPKFNPDVKTFYNSEGADHMIFCYNSEECMAIKRYLQSNVVKEEKENG